MLNVLNVAGRSKVPILLDCTGPGARPLSADEPSPHGFCLNRHKGRINGLFMDWSVREVELKELWTLKWCPNYYTAGRWILAGGVQPEDWTEWKRGYKAY